MAAAIRVCSRIAKMTKIAKSGSCFQGFASQILPKERIRPFSSSGAVYSATDGIESNPFYEKYAARIKEVTNDIKEGRL